MLTEESPASSPAAAKTPKISGPQEDGKIRPGDLLLVRQVRYGGDVDQRPRDAELPHKRQRAGRRVVHVNTPVADLCVDKPVAVIGKVLVRDHCQLDNVVERRLCNLQLLLQVAEDLLDLLAPAGPSDDLPGLVPCLRPVMNTRRPPLTSTTFDQPYGWGDR